MKLKISIKGFVLNSFKKNYFMIVKFVATFDWAEFLYKYFLQNNLGLI